MTLENNLFTDKESVNQFKAFVRKHPKLISAVRKKEKTWKETFEEWYLLGEDHEMWEKYKGKNNSEDGSSTNQSEVFKHLLGVIKNMDMNQLQNNITQVSGAISTIQEMIGNFQKPQNNEHTSHQQHSHYDDPFSFRRD
jgi:hypothetical protein